MAKYTVIELRTSPRKPQLAYPALYNGYYSLDCLLLGPCIYVSHVERRTYFFYILYSLELKTLMLLLCILQRGFNLQNGTS